MNLNKLCLGSKTAWFVTLSPAACWVNRGAGQHPHLPGLPVLLWQDELLQQGSGRPWAELTAGLALLHHVCGDEQCRSAAQWLLLTAPAVLPPAEPSHLWLLTGFQNIPRAT